MDEDDLRELELAIDTHGALSGEDSQRLITEVRRLRGDLDACTRSHRRLNADYERAVELLEAAERDSGHDVLTGIRDFLDAP